MLLLLLLLFVGASSNNVLQVHLALAGRNRRAVCWQTMDAAESVVRYGPSLELTAYGSAVRYYESYSHTVVLEDLAPGVWRYQVGNQSSNFTISSETPPFKVAIIGDNGRKEYGGGQVIEMLGPQFDFVWHNGDIGYADDAFLHSVLEFGYEDAWNEYASQMDWAPQIPWMVAPGNHEAECHSPACRVSWTRRESLRNFSAYQSRFRMPSEESGGSGNMWYSFEYGPLHIAVVNTETDYPDAPIDSYLLGGGQYGGFCDSFGCGDWLEWLENDLKNVDRERTPFILVGGHRPVYSVDEMNDDGTPSDDAAALQAAVEDLFYKYGVDVYFCGHKHAYERTFPVYKSVLTPNATVYVVEGAAGGDEGLQSYAGDPSPDFLAYVNDTQYAMGVLDVLSPTHIKFSHVGAGGLVLDFVDLYK
ncbi:hypothetical protein CTAYLR_004117 [Chrysophaeum taylorii]|uniref:Purple acid phosphatase n=1 Tax=Chrysophaeum taylorii TaxID=2483200 RepID=A0AAD7UEA4_9STRA|nr:hypothetical protein CTAYLR_004117 [Chrysophaeum taylorii]